MNYKVADKLIKLVRKKMNQKDMKTYALRNDVEGVLEEKNITYCSDFKMDYYVPEDKHEHDVYILDIHGGAWVYGKKELNRHFCMHLAKGGFSVFNMNYGLAPDYSVKQQIQQIFTTLQFIKKYEHKYNLNNAQVCLCGDSAGAHLASLAASIVKDKKLQKVYEVDGEGIEVIALLLQHGVYDLTPLKETKIRPLKNFYDWLFPKENKSFIQADCLDVLLNEQWDIPMFLLSSMQDKMFSSQTIQLVKKLKKFNIEHESLIWDESNKHLPHVFHILNPDAPESKESVNRMIQFVHRIRGAK